jgi:protein-histidine pros-kinase
MGIGMELTALAADGSGIPVEVSLSPVELDEGLMIASAIRDVRERKKLEAKLRERESGLPRWARWQLFSLTK